MLLLPTPEYKIIHAIGNQFDMMKFCDCFDRLIWKGLDAPNQKENST